MLLWRIINIKELVPKKQKVLFIADYYGFYENAFESEANGRNKTDGHFRAHADTGKKYS